MFASSRVPEVTEAIFSGNSEPGHSSRITTVNEEEAMAVRGKRTMH